MARRPGEAMISRPASPSSWRLQFLMEMTVSRVLTRGYATFRQARRKMATKSKSPDKASDLEIVPDAWERFERAVDTVIKSGPQHRQRAHDERKERPASKGRVHKGKSRA
jgi:hypothetical protein